MAVDLSQCILLQNYRILLWNYYMIFSDHNPFRYTVKLTIDIAQLEPYLYSFGNYL